MLSQNQIEILETALKQLDKGDELEKLEVEKKKFLKQVGLLSLKPKILVCNVGETDLIDGNEHTKCIFKEYPN